MRTQAVQRLAAGLAGLPRLRLDALHGQCRGDQAVQQQRHAIVHYCHLQRQGGVSRTLFCQPVVNQATRCQQDKQKL